MQAVQLNPHNKHAICSSQRTSRRTRRQPSNLHDSILAGGGGSSFFLFLTAALPLWLCCRLFIARLLLSRLLLAGGLQGQVVQIVASTIGRLA